MRNRAIIGRGVGAASLAAALGCLQPGIDPIYLTVLSDARPVPLEAHGLVVGFTQAGSALGALTIWRLGAVLPRWTVLAAAVLAFLCSVAVIVADSLPTVLACRVGYGLAMGVIYATTMAAYAARRPNKAYGAVYLTQLILSTVVSLALPELMLVAGAEAALMAMVLVPAFALVTLVPFVRSASMIDGAVDGAGDGMPGAATGRSAVPAAGWALAAATFWFICSTMLVWSFSAALATRAGIADRTIGQAVAIGSVVGALTAAAVMRERLLVPLPVTALLSGLALASPVVLTMPGADGAYVASIVLLNIGSTAIIIRCSGLATATSRDSRFRVFVACTHSLGLIAGPLLGTAMMALFGREGLLIGVALALTGGLVSVGWAVRAGFAEATRPSPEKGGAPVPIGA